MVALIVAANFGLLFTWFGVPPAMRILRRLGWAQIVRVDGVQAHLTKRGRPTKGGLVFLLGTVLGYLVAHLVTWTPPTPSALLVLIAAAGTGVVGFIDDHLKTSRQNSAGLSERGKIIGQLAVVAVFVPLALWWRNADGEPAASYAISFTRDLTFLDLARWGPVVGLLLVLVWVALMTVATTNAVNFTDGADGLLTAAAITTLAAYVLICLFQARQACAGGAGAGCFTTADPHDLAVLSCALMGSLAGYLWWSCHPVQIFMGDTGSLAIGGFFVALAVLTRTELLFPIIGVLYVMIGGSVVIQRYYFKLTGGKRFFRMAPLHHHFEMLGWAEETVTTRFWIISALGSAAGVSIFYGMWLVESGQLSP